MIHEVQWGISEVRKALGDAPDAAGRNGKTRIPFALTQNNTGRIMDLMVQKKLWLATENRSCFIPVVYERRSAILSWGSRA